LKEFLVYTATQEPKLEQMRQVLCSLKDFEPYHAFKRIDRQSN
jgi:hypothetical protein